MGARSAPPSAAPSTPHPTTNHDQAEHDAGSTTKKWNPSGNSGSSNGGSLTPEQEAIERDRDLAWELYDYQPEHPKIPELTQSVIAREPTFTGMIILLALHREACGEIDEARSLLQELMGRRDRQYVNAV